MRQLLTFEYAKLRPRPLGILMVLGIFFLVLLLEVLVGSIFYSIGYFGFKDQPIIASIIVNVGLWITKVVILVTVGKLVLENTPPSIPSTIRRWVEPKRVKYLLVISLAMIVSFRLAYDVTLGNWVLQNFGVDESFTESVAILLQAPILGIIFLWFIAPVFEEILYRGMVYGGLRRKGHGAVLSGLISALLFSIMHMNVAQSVNAFFLGLLFAYVYEKTGNLSTAIWLHMINNIYVTVSSELIELIMFKLGVPAHVGISLAGVVLLILVLKGYEKKAAQLSTEPLFEEAIEPLDEIQL